MDINPSECLFSLGIGLKYRPNFSLRDNFGNIIDDILYSRGSLFNEDFFPESKTEFNEHILFNKDTNNNLRIGSHGSYVEVVSELGNNKFFSNITTAFKNNIIYGAFNKYKLTQIAMIGLVNRYLIKDKDYSNYIVRYFTNNVTQDINSLDIKFTRRKPVPESLAKKKVNDHINIIYNIIKKTELDEIFLSIDYQLRYDPYLTDVSQIKFDDFVSNCNAVNNKEFKKLTNIYSEGSNVA